MKSSFGSTLEADCFKPGLGKHGVRFLGPGSEKCGRFIASIRTSLDAGMMREVLQGLLCARDISLEGIASLLELDLSVVKLYEGLFFDVRNREGIASSFKSSPPIDWKLIESSPNAIRFRSMCAS